VKAAIFTSVSRIAAISFAIRHNLSKVSSGVEDPTSNKVFFALKGYAERARLPRYGGDVWDMSQSDWESIVENGTASRGQPTVRLVEPQERLLRVAPSIPEEGLSNDAYALAFILFAGAVAAGFLAYSRRKRGAAAATVAAATQPPPRAGTTQAINP